jgi:hypothetical protein
LAAVAWPACNGDRRTECRRHTEHSHNSIEDLTGGCMLVYEATRCAIFPSYDATGSKRPIRGTACNETACRLYHSIGCNYYNVPRSSPALPLGRPLLLLPATSLPSGCCLVFESGGRSADVADNSVYGIVACTVEHSVQQAAGSLAGKQRSGQRPRLQSSFSA